MRTLFYPRAAAVLALLALVVAPATAQGPELTDAEIAHIAVTANAIDADLAELAVTRAADPRVREFASRMITDHRAVNTQAVALAGRLALTPLDNAVSQSLLAGAGQATSNLEGLTGQDFDRGYMDREVDFHSAVLEALDDLLIPNTTNEELRALLQQARGAIEAHLHHARALKADLEGNR